MSDLRDLIRELANSDEGSRDLDERIAEVVGWRKQSETYPQTGSEMSGRVQWFDEKGDTYAKVPAYTTELHWAFLLSQSYAPSNIGGCAWEDGMSSVKINDSVKAVSAATPALAMCVATLLQIVVRQNTYSAT